MSDKEPPVPPEKDSSSQAAPREETRLGYSGPEYDGPQKPVYGAPPAPAVGSPSAASGGYAPRIPANAATPREQGPVAFGGPTTGAFAGGAPPGGYAGAPGAYASPAPRPQRPPLEVRDARAIRQRSGIAVVVLSVLTCGVYFLYWIYATTSELRDALGDPEIKPGQDLALSIFTCSLWSIYTMYRNAQKVHAALLSRDPYVKDQSDMIVLLSVASAFFMGVTGLIAMHILQEELNKLARL